MTWTLPRSSDYAPYCRSMGQGSNANSYGGMYDTHKSPSR
jgi:hypothetical protein